MASFWPTHFDSGKWLREAFRASPDWAPVNSLGPGVIWEVFTGGRKTG